ncbi:heme-binding protein [Sphingomonas aliaeris]|uniref:Heme-binding protein n=1 Tax=Sphingomonas aliaeris TaxID=2759526 RepID=A0A974NW60_9SPHN|nr:heme-binding protein [Sphingomonas aliaeris]QQV77988.1 heme-binding protein [Sphingomonas aliaeris]
MAGTSERRLERFINGSLGGPGCLVFASAIITIASSTASEAQVRQQRTVSLVLADRIATATIEACRVGGRSAVVAVVDRGGNLVTLQRGDDVGPHNTIAAQKKAFTALSTKTSTSVLSERAHADPTSRNLNTVDALLLLGGGLPIMFDQEDVGAVGVAGSGGSAQDEACAMKGIVAGMAAPPSSR